jgi:hypothetical protein
VSVPAAIAAALPASTPPRPYAPGWLNRFLAWWDRLPGPRWLPYLVGLLVALGYFHAIAWSRGAVPVGQPDVTQVFWAVMGVALVWIAASAEPAVETAFRAIAPVLRLDAAAAGRLRYELIVVPVRPAMVATVVGGALTAVAMVVQADGPDYSGLTPVTAALAFGAQSFYFGILFQVLYRMIRQVRLVRRTLEDDVAIDVRQPAPLHGFASLTARPGMALIGLIALSIPLTHLPTTIEAFFTDWFAVLVVAPGIVAASFVLPVLGVHERLAEQKRRLEETAGDRLHAALASMTAEVDAGDLSRADAWNKTFTNLEAEARVLGRLSTWPWPTSTIRGLASAVALPMVLFLAQEAVSRFF